MLELDKMEIADRIERFIGYFEGELSSIKSIPASSSSKKFKKALYVSVIDALARCVYPQYKQNQNRDRFVSFLKRFSDWREGYNISMPHLAQLLRINPDPTFEKLRKIIFETYNNSVVLRSQVVGIDTDPSYDEIKKNWPLQKEAIEGVKLEYLQHFNLLYAYRNSLIHELREPGYGVEFDEDESFPYYHSHTMIEGDIEDKSIQLVYPVNFFVRITTNCINNLKTYLAENNLDPYSYYRFGTYWISDLND